MTPDTLCIIHNCKYKTLEKLYDFFHEINIYTTTKDGMHTIKTTSKLILSFIINLFTYRAYIRNYTYYYSNIIHAEKIRDVFSN